MEDTSSTKEALKGTEGEDVIAFIVEKSMQNLAKLLFLAWLVAWVLTKTSSTALLNVPLALAIVFGLRWLSLHFTVSPGGPQNGPVGGAAGHGGGSRQPGATRRYRTGGAQSLDSHAFAAMLVGGQSAAAGGGSAASEHGGGAGGGGASGSNSALKADASWRSKVDAPLVEHAWETLCGSIIQEFIYDAWYTSLTPDREFPAEARRIMNTTFGEVAVRARKVDLRRMIQDVSELVMETIELYRDTRDSIMAGTGLINFLDMTPQARERALRHEMKVENNLHPALATPDGQYKVLRAVSEGLAQLVLDRRDAQRPLVRVFARELLASSVLRPILMFLAPYQVNKLALVVLQQQQAAAAASASASAGGGKGGGGSGGGSAGGRCSQLDEEDLAALSEAKPDLMRGQWDFEQRLRKSAAEEDVLLAKQEAKKRQRSIKQQQYIAQQQQQRAVLQQARAKAASTAGTAASSRPGAASAAAAGAGAALPADSASSAAGEPSGDADGRSGQEADIGADATAARGVLPSLPRVSTSASLASISNGGGGAAQAEGGEEGEEDGEAGSSSPRSPFALEAAAAARPAVDQAEAGTTSARATSLEGLTAAALPPAPGPGSRPTTPKLFGGGTTGGGGGAAATYTTTTVTASSIVSSIQATPTGGVRGTFSEELLASVAAANATASGSTATSAGAVVGAELRAQRSVRFIDDSGMHGGGGAGGGARPASSWSDDRQGGGPGELEWGFIGRPRAKVVAADLNCEGGKDYVTYKVRVADSGVGGGNGGAGGQQGPPSEWTVSRRFRNFETLHRRLRTNAAYKLKLPPKRIFFHNQNVDFVEERREQLDKYLQTILLEPSLAGCREVWEFLCVSSDLYEAETNNEAGFLSKVTSSVGDVRFSMSNKMKKVGEVMEDIDTRRKTGFAALSSTLSKRFEVPSLMGDMSSTLPQMMRSISTKSTGGRQQLTDGGSAASGNLNEDRLPSAASSQSSDASSPDSRAAQRAASAVGAPAAGAADTLLPHGASGRIPRSVSSDQLLGGSSGTSPQQQQMPPASSAPVGSQQGPRSPGGASSGSQQTCRSSLLEATAHAKSSPQLLGTQRQQEVSPPAVAAQQVQQQQQRAPLGRSKTAPARRGDAAAGAALDCGPVGSSDFAAGGDNGHLDGGAVATGDAFAERVAASRAAGTSTSKQQPGAAKTRQSAGQPQQAGTAEQQQEEEDSTGISAPLYEIVDVVFHLQMRGFFRQKVFNIARQCLSLVAGAAIDEAMMKQLKLVRQEHTIARIIHRIQSSLWPGGRWYQTMMSVMPQSTERYISTPENFMISVAPEPLDAEEIASAVRDLLVTSAPSALVTLLGKQAYTNGVLDLFEMCQSSTMMQQLGYGLLEVLLVSLFPEMRAVFMQWQQQQPEH